jgi:hypothetical protein
VLACEATLAHIDAQIAALEMELAAIKAVHSLAAEKAAQHRADLAGLDGTVRSTTRRLTRPPSAS